MPSESQALMDWAIRFFDSVNAVRHPSSPNSLRVQLPREIDKELTDRPFFWMWAEAMNENPPETILHLQFDDAPLPEDLPQDVQKERIALGCYRMLRMEASAKKRGAFAVAYEQGAVLHPYVVFVVKISFVSDRRIDFLESYAISLRDQRVYPDAMTRLARKKLMSSRSPQSQIMSLPLDVDALFQIMFQCTKMDISRKDGMWAVEARKRLTDELSRLENYYKSMENETLETNEVQQKSMAGEYELRKAETIWRFEPKIEVRPLQFALVYLATAPGP
ncbi:YqhG family protein [Ferroacidibacillus organovorans]|uniref:Uncharacterized protein n=1 Tax=Ferroacidibacillus organovorans TaxID=1765683 RepID=A0A162TAX0_9BACL|nr:YqhG family protein [Ferroacidibacillus organovorans]KYP80624.1 hypothetical protein AYJ22_10620 [Ferroacidibacillus organovorans]OAG94310.1 hypothetical protein AYW79_06155 [Ferroacidibacillus organovorans]OPG16448.1 hypothetical protein B2M26_06105 [Ferroacidibacillus organovorans]